MSNTAVLIGQISNCRRLDHQLQLLERRPISIGWIIVEGGPIGGDSSDEGPVLGTIERLESIIAKRTPQMALITLPAAMKDLIMSLRTRLRKLGVADRFMPKRQSAA